MTDPLPAETLRALREKAQNATPGPWELKRNHSVLSVFGAKGLVASRWTYNRCASVAPDAEYIAACDPQTVLRLVATAEAHARLVDEVERLRETVRIQYSEIDALQERVPRRFGE